VGGELLKVFVLILKKKEASLTKTEADNSLTQAVA